jgi:hypothetical protein
MSTTTIYAAGRTSASGFLSGIFVTVASELPTRAPVVVFLTAFLIVKVPRPMLTIFAAAMAPPNRIGATSPTKSPRTIVNIFILVSFKLLTNDRGLGKGAVKNARASDVKAPHMW